MFLILGIIIERVIFAPLIWLAEKRKGPDAACIALVLGIFFGLNGAILSVLFVRARCPWCRSRLIQGAEVCRRCGRDVTWTPQGPRQPGLVLESPEVTRLLEIREEAPVAEMSVLPAPSVPICGARPVGTMGRDTRWF